MKDKYALALPKAIAWGSQLLVGKLDKSGAPYILHPLWIMNEVLQYGYDHAILAVVHDCPEDCFGGDIKEGLLQFRQNVIDDDGLIADLSLLSHYPGDTYAAYIQGIRQSQRATRVKKKDLEHNSSILRLKGLADKDIARIRKYHASYCYLNGDEGKLLEMGGF